MPPELKKPITNMNEMTCENCVFSDTPGDIICNNPNSDNWYRNNGEFCSEGQWVTDNLWQASNGEIADKLYVEGYTSIYTRFVRGQF